MYAYVLGGGVLIGVGMGLDVAECLFVDDMAVNLEGAEAVGMPGFYFDHTQVAASCTRLLGHLGLG
jgi:FMN phosphatase YigB (HAD superfamily)